MKPKILLIFLFFSLFSVGQKFEYAVAAIPDSLKQNANSVIRFDQTTIDITSRKSMTVKSITVMTVLNELGLRNLDLQAYYDKNRKITQISATAYDAGGKELKTYKRKDFKDVSGVDSGTIFSDSRVLYLDYTPISYPFTIVFETESETTTTAFIAPWSPIEDYLVSTQNSSITINYNPELNLKIKELNFSAKYPIIKKEATGTVTYSANNLVAKKHEDLTPPFDSLFPKVMFGLELFNLEGVYGNAKSWKEMGKWFYDEILTGTTELPEETKTKIKSLVSNEKDPLEIARIVYKYVQDKTRYVSIQEGIGGWKPMLAKDVDKLGYGDCKALTNYTRALLSEVGVVSYYARLYGSPNKKEIYPDIVSFQSNHVILAIPDKSNYIWLECTSQVMPFGYQGNFTDDRNAYIIKPDGGEIVRTKLYTENENLQQTKGSYQIAENGNFTGKVKIISEGLDYDYEFDKERISRENQIKYFKEKFDNINNLSIKKMNFANDVKNVQFTEELEIEAETYAQNSGGKLLFALNAFDQSSYVPKKYRNREFPFEMDRGYTYEAEIEVTIPDGFTIEAKPNGLEQNTEFGNYKIEFTVTGANKIMCKRKLVIKKGLYDKSKYEDYRKFRETIAKTDNSKIVIAKT